MCLQLGCQSLSLVPLEPKVEKVYSSDLQYVMCSLDLSPSVLLVCRPFLFLNVF